MTDLQPVPAATVVLVKDHAHQEDIEVLLVRRSSHLVFHGGHWVFPGGRVDEADFQAAGSELEYPAALKAAVRETREETGVELAEQRLIHTAHWTTPPRLPRRFCTWFFVYPVTVPVTVQVDQREILEHRWLRPAQALAAADRGELVLPHPTRVTVEDLADYSSLRALLSGVMDGNIRVFPSDSRYYRPDEMGYFRADS